MARKTSNRQIDRLFSGVHVATIEANQLNHNLFLVMSY